MAAAGAEDGGVQRRASGSEWSGISGAHASLDECQLLLPQPSELQLLLRTTQTSCTTTTTTTRGSWCRCVPASCQHSRATRYQGCLHIHLRESQSQ